MFETELDVLKWRQSPEPLHNLQQLLYFTLKITKRIEQYEYRSLSDFHNLLLVCANLIYTYSQICIPQTK
jgi:hypothetical protein